MFVPALAIWNVSVDAIGTGGYFTLVLAGVPRRPPPSTARYTVPPKCPFWDGGKEMCQLIMYWMMVVWACLGVPGRDFGVIWA